MERIIAKRGFVPKPGEDQLTEMVKDTTVVGVGHAGGAAVHLLLERPLKTDVKNLETRSFRRFGVGDVVPTEYRYVGHARVGAEWVFIYERMKA